MPEDGCLSRCHRLRGPGPGGDEKRRWLLRATRCVFAPASCRSVAMSMADDPAPTTVTSRPANCARSWCAELCVMRSDGRPASSVGTRAQYVIPVAPTTKCAERTSPSSSVSEKPSPVRSTIDDVAVLEIRDEVLLEVQRVLDEEIEAHRDPRVVVRDASIRAVLRERAFSRGRAQVGREPVGLQHHPGRHLLSPGVERAPEDPVADA